MFLPLVLILPLFVGLVEGSNCLFGNCKSEDESKDPIEFLPLERDYAFELFSQNVELFDPKTVQKGAKMSPLVNGVNIGAMRKIEQRCKNDGFAEEAQLELCKFGKFAAFLSAMCPRMRELRGKEGDPEDAEMWEGWEKVLKKLRARFGKEAKEALGRDERERETRDFDRFTSDVREGVRGMRLTERIKFTPVGMDSVWRLMALGDLEQILSDDDQVREKVVRWFEVRLPTSVAAIGAKCASDAIAEKHLQLCKYVKAIAFVRTLFKRLFDRSSAAEFEAIKGQSFKEFFGRLRDQLLLQFALDGAADWDFRELTADVEKGVLRMELLPEEPLKFAMVYRIDAINLVKNCVNALKPDEMDEYFRQNGAERFNTSGHLFECVANAKRDGANFAEAIAKRCVASYPDPKFANLCKFGHSVALLSSLHSLGDEYYQGLHYRPGEKEAIGRMKRIWLGEARQERALWDLDPFTRATRKGVAAMQLGDIQFGAIHRSFGWKLLAKYSLTEYAEELLKNPGQLGHTVAGEFNHHVGMREIEKKCCLGGFGKCVKQKIGRPVREKRLQLCMFGKFIAFMRALFASLATVDLRKVHYEYGWDQVEEFGNRRAAEEMVNGGGWLDRLERMFRAEANGDAAMNGDFEEFTKDVRKGVQGMHILGMDGDD